MCQVQANLTVLVEDTFATSHPGIESFLKCKSKLGQSLDKSKYLAILPDFNAEALLLERFPQWNGLTKVFGGLQFSPVRICGIGILMDE